MANRQHMLEIINFAQELAESGRYNEAYEAIVALGPAVEQMPQVVFLMASLAMQAARWRDALEILERLARRPVVRPVVWLSLAQCLIEEGRLGEAEEILMRQRKLLEERFTRHLLLARIAARREQFNETIAQINMAAHLDESALEVADTVPELSAMMRRARRID